ncbi:tetratricopeptide repeat protein [Oscillochloris sp. ZM17-4]|uniref:CheR family methyltransferase n=1 Tax=Oscillochloris sp. ZM17-4 TaxID=2866714 RepID=UPI001C732B43|nr:CheR family methyltransferase [Oscillochloris sp. ZM17-4]MBX0326759.1 tetratricopeptide repeat protein [Oscillochloris sp. ZM17-4]
MSQPITTAEDLSPAQVVALRDLLAGYCGVYLDDSRHPTLRGAARRRAGLLGQPIQAYADGLAGTGAGPELHSLAELLLNHETVFFRNRPHMAALRDAILPDLHRRLPPGAPIRIWSAGCATGEEAYSIAIAACEALGDQPARPIEILGSDLSEDALSRARAGVYRGRSLGNLSEAQRRRFFTPRGDGLAVGAQLRRMVRFERRNLLEPIPPEFIGVHLIFCQNVTIYFQVETCRALMGRFYEALAEGGGLFLGFSETLWNIFSRFRWREVSGTYVYYKESQRAALPPTAPLPPLPTSRPAQQPRQIGPRHPGGAGTASERGRALIDEGKADAALEALYATPLRGDQAPQILALAARAHANRGDLDLAAAEARRALELDPLTMEAHLLIGMIYARQDQPAEAIRQLERARYLDTTAPLISFHLAECYRQVGRTEAARREYWNTIQKLAGQPPDHLIDGVAVGWLAETCQRYLSTLSNGRA